MAIDILPCPLGYCACPRNGGSGDNCVFDITSSNSSSCAHNRTGTLCGKCPSGTVGVLTFFRGECLPASLCKSWQLSVPVFIITALVVVLLLVWSEASLTGDIRAFVFYFSVLPMLFMENDSVMLSLSGAESGSVPFVPRWMVSGLRFALRLADFSLPANCWFDPPETLDGIATGFIAPATLLLAIVIVFLLTLCWTSTTTTTTTTLGTGWLGLGGTASSVRDGNHNRGGPEAEENGGEESKRRRLGKLLFAWDLLRRFLLVAAYMPIYPLWYKQLVIRLLCLVFLVVQVGVRPYNNVSNDVDGAVSGSMLPCFRHGKYCNCMETAVLICVFAVSWLSVDTSATELVYYSQSRIILMLIFIILPLCIFAALVPIKLFLLFRRKIVLIFAKPARDVAMAPGTVQGRGERQRLLPDGPGRRHHRQRGASNEDGGRRCSIQ